MKYRIDDALYEIAHEIFDDEVLETDENFALYNEAPQKAEDEMYKIVDAMCNIAISAMLRMAAEYRDDYRRKLRDAAREGALVTRPSLTDKERIPH